MRSTLLIRVQSTSSQNENKFLELIRDISFYLILTSLFSLDNTWATAACWNPESGIPYPESMPAKHNISEEESETAVEQFWSNEVLHISGGIEEVGEVQWDLFACLILAWALVYVFIWKGLHNSGKVGNSVVCNSNLRC